MTMTRPRVNIAYLHAFVARASFVNDAQICGTNVWRDLTRARHLLMSREKVGNMTRIWRASKILKCCPTFQRFCPIFNILPNFQNFTQLSKFCLIFKILLDFQNFAWFSKFCPIFKMLPYFQNFAPFSKFCPIFKILQCHWFQAWCCKHMLQYSLLGLLQHFLLWKLSLP